MVSENEEVGADFFKSARMRIKGQSARRDPNDDSNSREADKGFQEAEPDLGAESGSSGEEDE